jgi:tetratricopeptide (TPR) repeat protein
VLRIILVRLVPLILLLLLGAGCGATKKARNEAEVHYLLGMSYLQQQNPTVALREFLQAADYNPGRADIQQGLGQAYYLKKAYAQAEEHYLRALKLAPDDPQIETNLAALYLDLQRWDDAIRYFHKAGRNLLFSSPEIALTGAGVAYQQKGALVDAIGAYKEALAANPRYAPAHLRLGETLDAMDKTELAVEEFRKALGLAPDYVVAHYRLALAGLKLRQPGLAENHFREVIRLAPDSEYGQQSRDYLKLLP